MTDQDQSNETDSRIIALHDAIRHQDIAAVEQAVASADRAAVANGAIDGTTPLNHAIHGGFVQAVEALLRAGANPAHMDANGQNPLHYAVIGERGKEMTELLLAHDAPINATTRYGLTPLDIARAFENEPVRGLLESRGGRAGRKPGSEQGRSGL